MAKKEIKDQLESYEGYINDIPLVIDPCRMCKYIDADKQSHIKNTEICRLCCWYYDSKFEVFYEWYYNCDDIFRGNNPYYNSCLFFCFWKRL